MKKVFLVMVLGLLIISGVVFAESCCAVKPAVPKAKPTIANIPAGKNFTTQAGTIFTYAYSSKPKIGTTILTVKQVSKNVFNGKLVAKYGMPDMSGAHDSGWVDLIKNKKGVYVVPISLVMPGEWQIDLRITEGKITNEYTLRLNI